MDVNSPRCHPAPVGALLCLLSAAGFGAMAVFGKLAYDEGVEVGDLLLVRFALASVALVAIAAATGKLRGLPRRVVVAGLGMGAIGYAAQSGLFFAALERMDASLLALILYVYPALVLAGAVALRRERATSRRVAALVVALAGVALVLLGAASGEVDAVAALLGFAAAVTYTVYILTGDRVGAGVSPLALSALICTGATCTFAIGAVVRGGPELGFSAAGWGWVGAIALVCTVAAILLFFAGLARVGPSTAAILSTLEPVVTVGLAAAVFGESLSAVQLLGGALVLGAVVVMQWPAGAPQRRGVRDAGASCRPRPLSAASGAALSSDGRAAAGAPAATSATASTSRRPAVATRRCSARSRRGRRRAGRGRGTARAPTRSSCRPRRRSRARRGRSPPRRTCGRRR